MPPKYKVGIKPAKVNLLRSRISICSGFPILKIDLVKSINSDISPTHICVPFVENTDKIQFTSEIMQLISWDLEGKS